MATGMPTTISTRNPVRSVPVIARPAYTRSPSLDRLLDCVLGPLQQAETPSPVLDCNLHRTDGGCPEPERADAVDQIHREIDDRHLQRAHPHHHLDREAQ